jgi:hypothetical protein
MKRTLPILFLAALLGGCNSTRSKKPELAAPVMSVQSAPINAAHETDNALPPPRSARSEYAPEPVYNLPRVKVVNLEPYVDEQGNSYGPQIKYVLENPGGWNLDALRNPSKAYVPQAMSPAVMAPASMTVAGSAEATPQNIKTVRDLYNLKDVTVTGFIERGQEPLAREMANRIGKCQLPFYDENLGWLLIPTAALQPLSQ